MHRGVWECPPPGGGGGPPFRAAFLRGRHQRRGAPPPPPAQQESAVVALPRRPATAGPCRRQRASAHCCGPQRPIADPVGRPGHARLWVPTHSAQEAPKRPKQRTRTRPKEPQDAPRNPTRPKGGRIKARNTSIVRALRCACDLAAELSLTSSGLRVGPAHTELRPKAVPHALVRSMGSRPEGPDYVPVREAMDVLGQPILPHEAGQWQAGLWAGPRAGPILRELAQTLLE